jgi:carbon storage regulator
VICFYFLFKYSKGDTEEMLILTRRPGETIRIGDDIEVHILNNDGYQTKVGITAPGETPVTQE